MAVIVFEGFDNQSTTAATWLVGTGWTVSFATVSVAGLLGGFGAGINNAQSALYNAGSGSGTFIMGFRYRVNSLPAAAMDFVQFRDAGTVRCGLALLASGKITFWRGTNATVLATSTTALIVNAWYQIEAKVLFDAAAGTYELRIGGSTEFSASGANTSASTTCSQFILRYAVAGNQGFYDDLYLCDATGGVANDFLGNVRVETLYPAADSATTWTPNSGANNFSRVNEAQFDSDTSYNSTSVVGSVDLFTHDQLSSSATTIYGVAVFSGARKADTPTVTYRNKLVSGVTTSNGSSHSADLTTTYGYYRDQYLTDPNGGAWTVSAVNATTIGYEYVS